MNRNPRKTRSGKPVNRTGTRVNGRAPARHAKHRRRRRSMAPALLAISLCAAAILCLAIMILPKQTSYVPATNEVRARSDGAAPAVRPAEAQLPVVTLQPQATAQPTEAPTPEPTEAPTPQPTAEPTPEPTATPAAVQYLPVVHSAKTDAKMIAITVDDCYQRNNLTTIVDLAEQDGGKLTLFPIGEAVTKSGLSALLKHSAFDLGFEIENHTWSHERIFRLPDEEMAEQIWKQDAALNQALGVNYQEHFLRLMGGDGDTDPRIHSYLQKLGYLGIANWSVSGSDSDMKHIKASLAPGQVYLFHCTDPDTEKLKAFIPWAVSKGYKLVTLNELFGLPDNETSPLTESAMPRPESGVDDGHTLKEGEYTWVALQLQEKLRSLGYLVMDGPSTGYYGPQTVKAVKAFQKDRGLPTTGEADLETQLRLLEG